MNESAQRDNATPALTLPHRHRRTIDMADTEATTSCSVDGCLSRVLRRGWCVRHYQRWLRHGDPLKVAFIMRDDEKRFWSRVTKDGPENGLVEGRCWLWTGKPNDAGYGTLRIGSRPGRLERAHRWLFLHEGGIIPDGFELDHLCRTPACVRPSHLEPVTHKVNVLRGVGISAKHSRKTHCNAGHQFNEANTLRTAKGWRVCRTCKAVQARLA